MIRPSEQEINEFIEKVLTLDTESLIALMISAESLKTRQIVANNTEQMQVTC